MIDEQLANQSAELLAQRAAAWRRTIDVAWSGDRCAHPVVDLLRTCRSCGDTVPEVEHTQ